jgi:hypothetical protein
MILEIVTFTSNHIFAISIFAKSNGSWDVGNDIWDAPIVN